MKSTRLIVIGLSVLAIATLLMFFTPAPAQLARDAQNGRAGAGGAFDRGVNRQRTVYAMVAGFGLLTAALGARRLLREKAPASAI